MLKLLKWAFKMGVRHERNRIKLFIAQHRNTKPEKPDTTDKYEKSSYERDLNLWHAVDEELSMLLDPFRGQEVYHQVERIAPIDEEL